MFNLVHFQTSFVAQLAAICLGREGFACFEQEGANACLFSNCLWVERSAVQWLLSWARGRKVYCEVVDVDDLCEIGGSF